MVLTSSSVIPCGHFDGEGVSMVCKCLQGDISVLVFFSCVEGVMAELHRNGNWWSETQAQCMVIIAIVVFQ